MKKRITALIISFSMIFATAPCVAADDEIQVSARAAALLCVDTGEFLYVKNGDERLPMASTTKIMTSLLALEAAQRNDKTVTFTK